MLINQDFNRLRSKQPQNFSPAAGCSNKIVRLQRDEIGKVLACGELNYQIFCLGWTEIVKFLACDGLIWQFFRLQCTAVGYQNQILDLWRAETATFFAELLPDFELDTKCRIAAS